jgi:hypothetical protein
MPTSKSKKKTNVARKEEKPRPYRVDYFDVAEMKKDRALVRSTVVRAVTADVAKLTVMEALGPDGFVRIPIQIPDRYIIRAYRFYKKLSAEPVKKTYLPLDKLFPAKRAAEIMTQIENPKLPIVLRPADFATITANTVDDQPERVKNVMAAIEAIDPTTLPQDHPDHVCTDACYGIVPLNEANEAKYFPQPKFGDAAPATVFVPEWGPDADTSNVAAGQPSPYLFPNKALVPQGDAAFDGGDDVVTSHGFEVCRWHGWKYIDLRDGRCTATDAGSGYMYDVKYQTELSIKRASGALQQFGNAISAADDAAKNFADAVPRDLDEAAPVLYPASEAPDTPSIWRPVTFPKGQPVVYDDSGFRRDPNQAVERSSNGFYITFATIAAIVGLVLAYFHWFKH